jgi:hypothetical protein
MTITAKNLVPGGRYNWEYQSERLIYLGRALSNGIWYQFALVQNPTKVWCEVRESDLRFFEETKL